MANTKPGIRVGSPLVWMIVAALGAAACSAGEGNGSNAGDGDGDGDSTGTGGQTGDGDGDSTGDGDGDNSGDGGGDNTGTGGQIGDGDGDGDTQPIDSFTLSQDGDLYIFTSENVSMTIDPTDGGRVTSLVVEGHETLAQVGAGQYGSVFWPSPQSLWDWPPPSAVDSDPYSVTVTGDQLTLTSGELPSLEIVVKKTYSPAHTESGAPAIAITYMMENTGDSAKNLAPWEISRVSSGTAFYPTGPAGQIDNLSNLTVDVIGNHTWYTYNPSAITENAKSFGDGSDGWIAWSTGSAVVIKSFPDVPLANFAPNEAEIEIYASPPPDAGTGDYMEVEQQGPVTTIAPGGSSTWTVFWAGVAIPDGSNTSPGSSDLINLVTTTL